MMPEAVSTCGAITRAGFSAAMAATTSAMGVGTQGDCEPVPVRRALSTVWDAGILPMSKIWVQRKLKKPSRITIAFLPVTNWRATASMP